MKRGVLIHPDGHVSPAFINEERDLYEQVGQLIDGYVTVWPTPHVPNLTFFCDEDGLIRKLKVNHLVTSILDQGLGSAPAVGTFLVMGRTDPRTGEPDGLTEEQRDIFLAPEGEILNALTGGELP